MPTFVILAHREPDLVARLARRLAPHPVVVHVDAKAPLPAFVDAVGSTPGVRFVPAAQRVCVNWAGFSMLRATLAGYRVALEHTAHDDHVVLLSGQDYPLKPVPDFTTYLREAPFRQHARMFRITPDLGKYHRHLVGHYLQDLHLPGRLDHPQARRLLLRAGRDTLGRRNRKMPTGAVFTFGSQWVALTGACVRWIVDNFATSPVARYTARSFAPDEKTIHSLVANSPFATEVQGGGPEPFTGVGTYRMANFHEIDPTLDKVFGPGDFDRLATSDKYFARKFTLASSSLLDRIDADLLTVSA